MKKQKTKKKKYKKEDITLLVAVILSVLFIVISMIVAVGFNRSYAAKKLPTVSSRVILHQSPATLKDCQNIKFSYFFKLSQEALLTSDEQNDAAWCSKKYATFWKRNPTSKLCKMISRYDAQKQLTTMVKKKRMTWDDYGMCQYNKKKK